MEDTCEMCEEEIKEEDWCWDIDKIKGTYFLGKFEDNTVMELYKKPTTFRSSTNGREWRACCPKTEKEFDYPIAWRPL